MSKAAYLTKEEKALAVLWRKQGKSCISIAEALGRSRSCISRYFQHVKENPALLPDLMKEQHPAEKPEIVNEPTMKDDNVKPSLNDFPPRDIIKHLYNLGYRIENNRLVCLVKQPVNLKDIINN